MRVGIVGLGAAGLHACALLESMGVAIEGFEARARTGGRLESPRTDDGVLYDAGGEWIDADQERVISLAEQLNVALDATGFWPGRVVHGDKHSSEDLLWADALEDDLRVEAAARELCRDLVSPPWKNVRQGTLDRRSLDDFLREHCTSERGLWGVRAKQRSDEGDDPEHVGLLGWLCGYLRCIDREPAAMSAYRFQHGAAAFCEAMRARIRGDLHLGHTLRHVVQGHTGVRLEFDEGSYDVERAILTLPPPAMERVVFDPPLDVPKRCAVEACGMGRQVKIAWQFDRAWWQDEEWNGRMLCDGPVQQTWSAGRGEAPVLCAYMCGDDAQRWATSTDPVRGALEELKRICPQAGDHFVRGWMHNWVSDPLAGGGFSHLAPGYVLDFMEHIGTPHGRVHMAGEHTAMWTGCMEGALESAERVAREIANA